MKNQFQIASNMITNYIVPACKRLKINKIDSFIKPETITILSNKILENKYTMTEFKEFIKVKEEDYQKDMDLYKTPFLLDSMVVGGVLNK